MADNKSVAFRNSILVKRDPDAYKRFLRDKERFEKYGDNSRADPDIKRPEVQHIDFMPTTELARVLARIYKQQMDAGLVPCGEEDGNDNGS